MDKFDRERYEANLRVLDLLRKLCEQHQEQRIGQIIANYCNLKEFHELFYKEPQEMERDLKSWLD